MDNFLQAIEKFKNGNFIIVMDNESRENEGDLIIPAENLTVEDMSFMIKFTSGIVCTPITKKRAIELDLPLMTLTNTDRNQTNFTMSCDYKIGTTTGVSAEDRYKTCKALVNKSSNPLDFSKPGHIFPLIAKDGGLKEREGHTEATIDLLKLANKELVGVIGELNNEDGTMKNYQDCKIFSEKYDIPIITVEDIKNYMSINNIIFPELDYPKIKLLSECDLTIQINNDNEPITVKCSVFQSFIDYHQHIVLSYGDVTECTVPLRIHSECFTGNVLHSLHCDCDEQLQLALKKIKELNKGIIIYHQGHEGRGIGLANKIKAYDLQNKNKLDTIDANLELGQEIDSRNYDNVKEICRYYGISKISLITNNPYKINQLKDLVEDIISLKSTAHKYNKFYLETKRDRLNHTIEILENEKIDDKLRKLTFTDFSKYKHLLESKRIGIVKTNWNKEIIDKLSEEYKNFLIKNGILEKNIFEYIVPGAFEIPLQTKFIAKKEKFDSIICLGAVIKGETPHFEYISNAVSLAIMNLQLELEIPIIYGVLSCYNYKQAFERANGEKALQEGWANSTIQMLINTHQE